MSRNSLVLMPWLAVAVVACAGAAPATCPASISDGGVSRQLIDASLFDGPPEEMADLIPIPMGAIDKWNLDSVDPFSCAGSRERRRLGHSMRSERRCAKLAGSLLRPTARADWKTK